MRRRPDPDLPLMELDVRASTMKRGMQLKFALRSTNNLNPILTGKLHGSQGAAELIMKMLRVGAGHHGIKLDVSKTQRSYELPDPAQDPFRPLLSPAEPSPDPGAVSEPSDGTNSASPYAPSPTSARRAATE